MQCVLANVNITIIEGGTFDKMFQWKTGDLAVPVDLSGYTAEMNVRKKTNTTERILRIPFQDKAWIADGDSGIYIPYNTEDEYDEYDDPEDIGKFRVYIKDNDSMGICPTHKEIEAVYDLFLYNHEGESVFKMYGTATLVPAVTRDEA